MFNNIVKIESLMIRVKPFPKYLSLPLQIFTMRYSIILLFASVLVFSCSGLQEDPAVTAAELSRHLGILASDSLKGRYPGTEEDGIAAEYIAREFRKAGLEWITDDGLQPFEVITDLEKGTENYFRTGTREGILDEDFAPFPFSGNIALDAEVVFAGYGLEINDEQITWNDYAEIDIRGKWAMVLMGNPEIDSTNSPFHAYSNERDKAMLALDKGAAGILFVAGPVFDQEDRLTGLDRSEGKVTIPAIQINRSMADYILQGSSYTIADLESRIIREARPFSLTPPCGKKLSKPTYTLPNFPSLGGWTQ